MAEYRKNYIIWRLLKKEMVTTKQLAHELNVTERTILRDMKALTSKGIPIYSHRGRFGGWSLLGDKSKENKDSQLSWKTEENSNLSVSEISSLLQESVNGIFNESFRIKDNWTILADKIEMYKTLRFALCMKRQIVIKYQKNLEEYEEVILRPLDTVEKDNEIYLVGFLNDKFSSYKLSNIHSVRFWSVASKSYVHKLENLQITVEVPPEILQKIWADHSDIQIKSNNGKGWIPITIGFNSERNALSYILGFGDSIRVLEPMDIKRKIINIARNIRNSYETK